MRFLIRWAINTLALFAAVWIVPGIRLNSGWFSLVWLGLIFGLVNATIRPVLKLLTCPLILLTLGLFTLVINALMLSLTAWIGNLLGIELVLDSFWAAFWGALVVSVVSVFLSLFVREEKERD
ncbi:MAG: phage holin family protein [Anaerolineales bacterium]